MVASAVVALVTLAPAQGADAAAGPEARAGASMAFDAATGALVLFGGSGAGGVLNDTWLFDGARWRRAHPTTSPSPRRWASLTDDPSGHGLILFGGLAGTTVLGDTWRFDAGTWTRVATSLAPSPRYGSSMATDRSRRSAVLFGGAASDGTDQLDTWTWDGSAWHIAAGAGPQARHFGSMAYERTMDGLVLFGGITGGGALNDTWLWDGLAWIDQPIQLTYGPAPRSQAGLAALDDGPAVLAGGIEQPGDGTSTLATSTSVFLAGSLPQRGSWMQLSVSPLPERAGAAMAAMPATHQIIMFGGAGETGLLADTLVWSGSDWIPVT